jgi:hypothetical protein
MTPSRQAALKWAIGQAEMKALTARRGRDMAPSAWHKERAQAEADQFQSHIYALQQILNGEPDA